MKILNPHWGWAMLGLTALITGCTVGPDYHQPVIDTGKGWAEPVGVAGTQPDAWWTALHDAQLNQLVDLALSKNPDLQASRARIMQSRAARDEARSVLLPQAQVQGSIDQLRQSVNGPLPLAKLPFIPRDETIRDIEFDASWQLDLFGGARRGIESAQAQHQAAIANAQDLQRSLVAELVRDYVNLRGDQRQLLAQQAELVALNSNIDAIGQRVAAGDVPVSELDEAVVQRETIAASLPTMQANLRALALSIGVLTGQPPESGLYVLNTTGQDVALVPIPVGERADVLRRRPDVRAAERQLASATADIGVATAQWFPQLGISAAAGFQSLEPGNLLTEPSQIGSIMPLISWRILDGGRIQAQIHAAKARQQIAAQNYTKIVLTALNDAERSLSDYQRARDSLVLMQGAFDAAQRAQTHMQARFAAGDVNRQDAVTSQLALAQAQINLQAVRTVATVDWVALNNALD